MAVRQVEMNAFREAAEQLNITEVAQWLGLEVKQGYALCPFHRERTPSFKLYKHNFHCFGCGAHGDSINLAVEVLGISPFEALKALNQEFQLNINLCDKPSKIKRTKGKASQNKFQEWRLKALDTLAYFIRRNALYEGLSAEVARAEALHQEILSLPPEVAYTYYQEDIRIYERYRKREHELTELAGEGNITIESVLHILGGAGTV